MAFSVASVFECYFWIDKKHLYSLFQSNGAWFHDQMQLFERILDTSDKPVTSNFMKHKTLETFPNELNYLLSVRMKTGISKAFSFVFTEKSAIA